MLKIGIILGSTRPGRVSPQVGKWVHELAKQRTDAQFEVVDIADYDLPIYDETVPPGYHNYQKDHTKKWAEKIGSLDGFVFVVAEYNHSITGALKNALDFIYAEWNNKSAGFVSYGSTGGARAVEHLRGIMAELPVADVRGHVSLSGFTDFENWSVFKPAENHKVQLDALLGQVIAWGGALQDLREKQAKKA